MGVVKELNFLEKRDKFLIKSSSRISTVPLIMKKYIDLANKRGYADYGWLVTHHTFSFGDYYNPHRMNFGALRVLNDDVLQGSGGFGVHGHKNMEIISIPLQGALLHGDDQGYTSIVRPNDVQVMSAGKGIMHKEQNHSSHQPVNFLQLWILPEAQNLPPRYAQYSFDPKIWENQFAFLIAPQKQQSKLWIHQQAVIARTSLTTGSTVSYTLQDPDHGVYIIVVEGKVSVEGVVLTRRDGMGVENINELTFQSIETCDMLL